MPDFEIRRGDIFFLNLTGNQGFEIQGPRPVVVIQNDIGNERSNSIIVAAMTRNTRKSGRIFVKVSANESGLNGDGTVLLDQIFTVSKERFSRSRVGRLSQLKMLELNEAIKVSLGLK